MKYLDRSKIGVFEKKTFQVLWCLGLPLLLEFRRIFSPHPHIRILHYILGIQIFQTHHRLIRDPHHNGDIRLRP